MTTTLTAYNFLNITPNELILFPTSLKYCLVYFKVYLKIFQTTFCTVFEICVICIFFGNRIFGREGSFQKIWRAPPPLHTIKGKHSEPQNNIFGVLVDTFITPPYFGELVISCDMIILHGCILVISLLSEMNILVMVSILMCLACMPERNLGKPLPWVGVSLSPVPVGTVMSGMA